MSSRPVFVPGRANDGARRTPRPLAAGESPPTERTPRPWWDRRRAGIGARARGERCAGRPWVAPPSRWSAGARLPTKKDRAGRRRIPQPIRDFAERPARLAVRHPRATEEATQASGQVLRDTPGADFVRQPPEREDREVPCRDDVRAVTRPPHLDERRVLPCRRLGPRDAGMDGEERSAGHAVLQARPRRAPERAPSARKPLVERADVPTKREDLRPREVEPRFCRYALTT